MDQANKHSWSTHFDNLFKMLHYCENKTDCRRVWMLGYFGEIFDKSLCLNNPETSCDNCCSKVYLKALLNAINCSRIWYMLKIIISSEKAILI